MYLLSYIHQVSKGYDQGPIPLDSELSGVYRGQPRRSLLYMPDFYPILLKVFHQQFLCYHDGGCKSVRLRKGRSGDIAIVSYRVPDFSESRETMHSV